MPKEQSWFRFYVEALDDPKVQDLEGDVFKAWVNLLCVARKYGGVLSALKDIAFHLRSTKKQAEAWIAALQEAELIDQVEAGLEPHNWRGRQYESDNSGADRTRKWRERRKVTGDTDSDNSVTSQECHGDSDGDSDGDKVVTPSEYRIQNTENTAAAARMRANPTPTPTPTPIKASADPPNGTDFDLTDLAHKTVAEIMAVAPAQWRGNPAQAREECARRLTDAVNPEKAAAGFVANYRAALPAWEEAQRRNRNFFVPAVAKWFRDGDCFLAPAKRPAADSEYPDAATIRSQRAAVGAR